MDFPRRYKGTAARQMKWRLRKARNLCSKLLNNEPIEKTFEPLLLGLRELGIVLFKDLTAEMEVNTDKVKTLAALLDQLAGSPASSHFQI